MRRPPRIPIDRAAGPARYLAAAALVAALALQSANAMAAPAKKPPRAPATIDAPTSFAPQVPLPIHRSAPATLRVRLVARKKIMPLSGDQKYEFWTFNDHVPGPFIRARVGDVLEVHVANQDESGMPHNVDFHAVTGPGGGATVTTVTPGEERVAWFKLLTPGLFFYHCAAPPVMDHIANGMYGLILVEPASGLPKVAREFYVVQSEFYTPDAPADAEVLQFSHDEGLREHPRFVVFNGRVGSLIGDGQLKAKTGDTVRIFFANAGPNLISSFHVIGEIFDRVYREGDLISPPAHGVQTTLVPAGGTTLVEFKTEVPGTYTLVDHAIFRVAKGAAGFLEVEGAPRDDIYRFEEEAKPCEGCLVHP
jgi:copper-containing nitrite reductase